MDTQMLSMVLAIEMNESHGNNKHLLYVLKEIRKQKATSYQETSFEWASSLDLELLKN